LPPAAALLTAALLTFAPHGARADLDTRAQMLLGNPSGATASPSDRDNYLLRRPHLALAYDDALRFPRWVAWHLNKGDIGETERGQFQPDPMLPDGFKRVTPSDYTRTGYDRGHNCPSKDRSATRADNDAVFYMTNMTPQAHGLNAGPWQLLESYCRDLTAQGNELYIYAGHWFTRGKPDKRVGRAGVAVPDYGWKVIVVLPDRSGNDLRRVDASTRVIAVRMPNISTIARKDWREYRTSVADIEQATGLKFFDALPADVASALKNKVDYDRAAPSKVVKARGGKPAAVTPAPAAGNAAKVWVNTRSGAYWLPGTQFYGKTKQGKYMTEAEAVAAGYHKAGGQ
jgi:endonuclease G